MLKNEFHLKYVVKKCVILVKICFLGVGNVGKTKTAAEGVRRRKDEQEWATLRAAGTNESGKAGGAQARN